MTGYASGTPVVDSSSGVLRAACVGLVFACACARYVRLCVGTCAEPQNPHAQLLSACLCHTYPCAERMLSLVCGLWFLSVSIDPPPPPLLAVVARLVSAASAILPRSRALLFFGGACLLAPIGYDTREGAPRR